jgi:L-alanine-DL-glutamate epimerase-like enolase superfamily enzyme
MEYCVEPSELSRALVTNPIAITDGFARIPQEPGLGVEPRIDIIEKYRVAG